MKNLVVKTDHSHICETAEYYFENGIKALEGVDEKNINIKYIRNKVFCAIIREIILAVNYKEYVVDANKKAEKIVKSYELDNRLIVFMNSFITDNEFRESLVLDIKSEDYLRVVDTICCNCGVHKNKKDYKLKDVVVLGNDKAQSVYNTSCKKAELGVILNSLNPFMFEVLKIRVYSMDRSIAGKCINAVLRDLGVVRRYGKLYYKDSNIVYNRQVESIIINLVALMLMSEKAYKDIVNEAIKNNNILDIISYIGKSCNFIKCKSALYDLGLRSLVNYY